MTEIDSGLLEPEDAHPNGLARDLFSAFLFQIAAESVQRIGENPAAERVLNFAEGKTSELTAKDLLSLCQTAGCFADHLYFEDGKLWRLNEVGASNK